MQELQDPTPTTRKGWNWGWSIATVYTVFALATIAWAVYSFSQKVELVSNDYYTKEINYDAHAAEVKNALALQQPVQGVYDASQQEFVLTFPLQPTKGTVTFYRPSGSDQDRSFNLSCNAESSMTTSTKEMAHGLWRVKIEWEADGTPYYNEFKQVL